METATSCSGFDGNSFDGYAPCFRTRRQRRLIFGANPRRAVVFELMTLCHRLDQFREVTKLIELVTFCYRLGFLPAVERLLVLLRFPLSIFEKGFRRSRFPAFRARYSSPLQLWVGSLARCGRLAFPVAVEVKLPNCMTLGKNKIAKLSALG